MKKKILIGLVSLLSFKAIADEYHYVNLLNGSSAAGLGGTYIAVADDLTAMLYNPAGLSISSLNSTASMNVLSWEQTKFNQVFSDGSDFVRDSFIVVPGFFAFRKKHTNWDYGMSFAVTDFSKERTSTDVIIDIPQNDTSPAQQRNEFVYIDLENSAYKLGLSTAFRYSETLTFGASLYLQYKEFTTVQGSGIATKVNTIDGSLGSGFDAKRRITDLQISVQPILGALWQKNSFSLGGRLAYEIPIKRSYEATATILLSSLVLLPPNISIISRITEKATEKQNLPFTIGFGASYQFANLLLTGDINYFSEVDDKNKVLEKIKTPITRKLKEIVNWSIGIEYDFSQETAIHLGIFTDKSNGEIDTSINYQRIEDIDFIGFSASVETKLSDNKLTYGFYYKQGVGDVRFADVRSVESVVGLPLYPDTGNFDIAEAKKESLVLFLGLDF